MQKGTLHYFLLLGLIIGIASQTFAQHSVARKWNEATLLAIRNDFARPTVHARNLFHTSVAMYDVWAAYEPSVQTFFLGKKLGAYTCPFNGVPTPLNIQTAREEAISYAMYRLLNHRFKASPGAAKSLPYIDSLFVAMGYDKNFTSSNYSTGTAAALGNYIAEQLIAFGLQDGANERNSYGNLFYKPVNSPLVTKFAGNTMEDPNRWQPLSLDVFIDQSGNVIPVNTPLFLSPEWGRVTPFSLKSQDLTMFTRNNNQYPVYHDPGTPPQLSPDGSGTSAAYQWNFDLVSCWSAHLDPRDGVMWDVSPAGIGNTGTLPKTFEEYKAFYNIVQGGVTQSGHKLNPVTGKPYTPQMVPRGDYTRVLAEFWADGPSSETPPGHWFSIANYVADHPAHKRKFKGQGEELSGLEWDVKTYFILGGAMHDAAVSAWGIKGWYDYVRPVSAIRYMGTKGQSSDNKLSSYSAQGMQLIPGLIETVQPADTLTWAKGSDLGKVKVKAWRGPNYITDPATTYAGVGWILAEGWWPYQRPTFVSPPFAGLISGHSTFSRTGAEVMTMLTGDAYFPGGMGEFVAKKNEYLKFEEGPTVDVILQWATYRDASDQSSLSRIWGGIHPPADDIPGRVIGEKIGKAAFAFGEQYFSKTSTPTRDGLSDFNNMAVKVYPNPISSNANEIKLELPATHPALQFELINQQGAKLRTWKMDVDQFQAGFSLHEGGRLTPGVYYLRIIGEGEQLTKKVVIVE
jgi:hypothetical protein